jgi:hypothetical protein
MTQITSKQISADTAAFIKDWAKLDNKVEDYLVKLKEKRTLMLDDLVGQGIAPHMLEGAGKGKENTPLYKSIHALFVSLQPVARRHAIGGNPETMTKKQKAYRRESMQRVGSKISKLREALKGRLEPKKGRATGGVTNQSTSASAPAANNTSATPLKSYIEKVSTGRDVVKAMPPSVLSAAKYARITKLIGDLLEELNSIK